MDWTQLIDKFGIFIGAGLATLFLYVFPFLRDKYLPSRIQQSESDRSFAQSIELRRIESAERTEQAIGKLAQSNIETNVHMTTMLSNQVSILQAIHESSKCVNDALTRMEVARAKTAAFEEGKKQHKKGDTGQLTDK